MSQENPYPRLCCEAQVLGGTGAAAGAVSSMGFLALGAMFSLAPELVGQGDLVLLPFALAARTVGSLGLHWIALGIGAFAFSILALWGVALSGERPGVASFALSLAAVGLLVLINFLGALAAVLLLASALLSFLHRKETEG